MQGLTGAGRRGRAGPGNGRTNNPILLHFHLDFCAVLKRNVLISLLFFRSLFFFLVLFLFFRCVPFSGSFFLLLAVSAMLVEALQLFD